MKGRHRTVADRAEADHHRVLVENGDANRPFELPRQIDRPGLARLHDQRVAVKAAAQRGDERRQLIAGLSRIVGHIAGIDHRPQQPDQCRLRQARGLVEIGDG